MGNLLINPGSGNKGISDTYIGLSDGNHQIIKGYIGTSSGNKLFYEKISIINFTIDSIPYQVSPGTTWIEAISEGILNSYEFECNGKQGLVQRYSNAMKIPDNHNLAPVMKNNDEVLGEHVITATDYFAFNTPCTHYNCGNRACEEYYPYCSYEHMVANNHCSWCGMFYGVEDETYYPYCSIDCMQSACPHTNATVYDTEICDICGETIYTLECWDCGIDDANYITEHTCEGPGEIMCDCGLASTIIDKYCYNCRGTFAHLKCDECGEVYCLTCGQPS